MLLKPQEELIELLPLNGQTRGEDILSTIVDCLKMKEISTGHIISVATDGAPNMKGAHKGFITMLQKAMDRNLLSFHCIIHQEALCAKTFPPVITEVVQIINKIKTKGLNHGQFCDFLKRSTVNIWTFFCTTRYGGFPGEECLCVLQPV